MNYIDVAQARINSGFHIAVRVHNGWQYWFIVYRTGATTPMQNMEHAKKEYLRLANLYLRSKA